MFFQWQNPWSTSICYTLKGLKPKTIRHSETPLGEGPVGPVGFSKEQMRSQVEVTPSPKTYWGGGYT